LEDLNETIEISKAFEVRFENKRAERLAELLGLAPDQWQKALTGY